MLGRGGGYNHHWLKGLFLGSKRCEVSSSSNAHGLSSVLLTMGGWYINIVPWYFLKKQNIAI